MTEKTAPVSAGVLAAVLTPVTADLAPDHARWIAHCRWLLDQGCDGLAVHGTTSEANSFSVTERLAMLDALAAAGVPGAKLIPGTGCCAIPDTVALSKKAVEIGAAGVLMLPPFYYKPVSDEGLFAAYSEIIQRVGDRRLKIYLYHIPQNSGVPITHGLIEKLIAAYPDTVVGIKDSAGQLDNMAAICKRFPGFRVFSGSDALLLGVLRAGGAGSITACNNIAAATSRRIYDAWRNDRGAAAQDELSAIRAAVSAYPLIAALKEVVARATGQPGWRRQRPPLEPLDAKSAEALMAQLSGLGFAMKRAA